MPSIGPSPPPQPTKRSRSDGDDRSSSPENGEKRRRVMGPAPPPSKPSPPRIAGPALPPASRSRSSSIDSDVGPAPPPASKPARVMGPAPPPAPLDEQPPNPPSDNSDSSDDDFGPAPPPVGAKYAAKEDGDDKPAASIFDTDPQYAGQTGKVERDAWMSLPPTQDDLASRMDPTKMRARKFNTGKGARAPASGGDGMNVWTETPEQKLKRLQNEAMGISAPSNSSSPGHDSKRNREEEAKARKIREKVGSARGKSLVEQHAEKTSDKKEEDDPSKRAFNYEKDMASGTTISNKQRKEMLSKAKGFGDRFSSGSFL